MHDSVDIRRRIDRLVARIDRRDDYGQLLASGQVIHELEDVDEVEAWRAEIRRQARADKIKVRTGLNDGIVWALRVRSPMRTRWRRGSATETCSGAPLGWRSSSDTNRSSPFGTATS